MSEIKTKQSSEHPEGLPQITIQSADFLVKTAKWGKFLAIFGFVVTGLLIAGGILMLFITRLVSEEMIPLGMQSYPIVFTVIALVVALLYLIPVLYLNSFCNNALKAVNFSDSERLTASMKSLRNLFVFLGISTIAILAIYSISLIMTIVAVFITA